MNDARYDDRIVAMLDDDFVRVDDDLRLGVGSLQSRIIDSVRDDVPKDGRGNARKYSAGKSLLQPADNRPVTTGTGSLNDNLDFLAGVEGVIDSVGSISETDEGVCQRIGVYRSR